MTLSLWKGDCLTPAERARSIVASVSADHGVPVAEIMGDRFVRKIAYARQDAYWRIREELGWSHPHIGRFFGNRDHTTILHGVRAHEKRLEVQPQ